MTDLYENDTARLDAIRESRLMLGTLDGPLTEDEKLAVHGPDYSRSELAPEEQKVQAKAILDGETKGRQVDMLLHMPGFAVLKELADSIITDAQRECNQANPITTVPEKLVALQHRQAFIREGLETLFSRLDDLESIAESVEEK